MTKSFIEKLTRTKEGDRLFQQEKATLDATELICRLMGEQNVSIPKLAKRLEKTPGYIDRILDGRVVLTIQMLSDMVVALGHTIQFNAIKRK